MVCGDPSTLVLALCQKQKLITPPEFLIAFNCKTDVCPSLALSNKNIYDEKTAAALKLYFKK